MTENDTSNCGRSCSAGPKLVFACSDAADVGALADQAARLMTREGTGKMFCLAGAGGRVSGIMKTTEAAAGIVAIDDCPLNCAQKNLRETGFTAFTHLQLAEMGFKKGETPVESAVVRRVADAAAALSAA